MSTTWLQVRDFGRSILLQDPWTKELVPAPDFCTMYTGMLCVLDARSVPFQTVYQCTEEEPLVWKLRNHSATLKLRHHSVCPFTFEQLRDAVYKESEERTRRLFAAAVGVKPVG